MEKFIYANQGQQNFQKEKFETPQSSQINYMENKTIGTGLNKFKVTKLKIQTSTRSIPEQIELIEKLCN